MMNTSPSHEDPLWAFSPDEDFQSSLDLSFMDMGSPTAETTPEKVQKSNLDLQVSI